ncbi:membrane hypothetical protein [Candidatus Sulfopaludibacter sp. SbA4]|nr:membrane hypothetical protein [Candidatus Sulfopaludibacter sp. SbA4]
MTKDPKVLANRLLQRAWNRDGLPEIGSGLFSLVAAGLIYAMQILPRRSPGQIAAILIFAFVLPLYGFCAQPLVKRIRSRWLLERAGYVQHLPNRNLKRNNLRLLAVMAVVMPLVFLAFNYSERLLLPMTGALGALICGLVGWSARMVRLMAGGAIMLATAILLALSSVPVMIGMAILFGSQGLYYLLTGGVAFLRFMNDER